MFNLIDDKELTRLQQQVASLEQERAQVESEAHRLRLQVQQAREHDLSAEAVALNAGKKPPKPQEPELRAKLEEAERQLEVLQRRLQLSQSDVATYVAEHRGELREALINALGDRAAELAEHARAATKLYAEIMDNQRLLRKELASPAPQEEATGPGRNTVNVLGVATRTNAYGEPYDRGHIEAMLGYLGDFEQRYPEPSEAAEAEAEPVEADQGAA